MSEQQDIKKALETILDRELPDEEFQRFAPFRVASYNMTRSIRQSDPDLSFLTTTNIFTNSKHCEATQLLDVSGIARTGNDGKSLFRLTRFFCPDAFPSFESPINVVATPLSSMPCFATVMFSLVDDGQDVEIQVFTWDANGEAAVSISYDWRCRVVYREIPG
jgi:hypothetical protein